MDGDKRRACTNCARLKMKCRYLASHGDCARCSRMKLECKMPENTPRRPRGKSTRVAQLEQKIDGLVSMLSATTRQTSLPSPDTTFTPATNTTDQTASPNCPVLDGVLEMIPGFRITLPQASQYLDLYRREYMPNFPFVIIETTDAVALYTKSPCLFWVIMSCVAVETENMQESVTEWLRKYLSERVIYNRERSIEYLQSILLYVSWGIFQFYITNDGGVYLHLAHILVDELGLNKPPDSNLPRPNSMLRAAWATMKKEITLRPKQAHSAEDRRAMLGFYHITALLDALLHRGPRLQWPEYATECCDFLERGNHHPYDTYIVSLIRLQIVSQEANKILVENKQHSPAVEMALSSAHQRIDSTFQSLPVEIQCNKQLQIHYNCFILSLYEPILSLPDPAFSCNLGKVLPAVKAFYKAQMSIPIPQLACRPFTQTAMLSFYIVFVADLVFYEGPGWDASIARREIDYGLKAQELAVRFDEADSFATLNKRRKQIKNQNSLFHEYGVKLRWVSHWYRGRVAESTKEMEEQQQLQESLQWDEKFWEELLFLQPNYPLGDV